MSMFDIFMKSPLPNTLAVGVLLALIIAWLTSIILTLRAAPVQTEKGWFPKLLPGFSILGVPAALDLLQTKGISFFSALIVLAVFALNIIVPILKISGKSKSALITDWYQWSHLFSTIGGLAVAGYLTYAELSGATVTCGPAGGCELVQNSRYAFVFGIHVSIIGLIGYIGILASWLTLRFASKTLKKITAMAMWGMCFFGVLFSAYLTFLEPFVIGATCMWCIASAVLMLSLLLVSTPAAQEAFAIQEDSIDDNADESVAL